MTEIHYISYYNCFEMLLDALLKKKNIDIKYLFKRPSLFIEKNLDSPYPILQSKIQNIKDTMKECNIIGEYMYLDNFASAYDFVRYMEKISENGSCGTSLSTYSIPYSPHFHKLGDVSYNQLHMFQIEKIEKDKIFIVDHFYQYAYTVSIKEYINMINETVLQNDKHAIFTYSIKNNVYTLPKDCYNQIQRYYFDMNLREDNSRIYGLHALQSIIEFVKARENKYFVNENIENSYEFSEMFKNISDAQYQFGEFLMLFHHIELSQKFSKLGQMWLVLSNLFLKAYLGNEYNNLKGKIISCLNSILQYQKSIISFIKIHIMQNYA